jgi:hypothetical protein
MRSRACASGTETQRRGRLEADDDLGAMLLERCEPGTALRALAEPEQDLVIARLLNRLWRLPSAPHSFRPLSDLTAYWSAETRAGRSGGRIQVWSGKGCACLGTYHVRRHARCCWRPTRSKWDPVTPATQNSTGCVGCPSSVIRACKTSFSWTLSARLVLKPLGQPIRNFHNVFKTT